MPDFLPDYDTGDKLQSPVLDYLVGMPLIIQIALSFSVISVIFIFVIQFRILFTRYKGSMRQKRLDRIVPEIDGLISEYIILRGNLFNETTSSEHVPVDTDAFRGAMFYSKKNKQILIDRLINYRKSFGGNIGSMLRTVYLDQGLDKLSFKKMKSFRWNAKIKGIRELTDMDISISDVNILPLTNSKRHELRAEARNAYIKLSKNEPFKFFDITTEPLLMWDQIELFKTITTTENIAIPNFARWVTYSSNKSIISFCMKLIVYYNQVEASAAVAGLLDNKDHILRGEAINCLGKLKYEVVEQKLIHIYSNQPLNCQLEILKALGRMETGNSLPFLRHEFLYSTDFDVRKNAARSVVRTADDQLIRELMESSTAENQLILKHSMNPLIKY